MPFKTMLWAVVWLSVPYTLFAEEKKTPAEAQPSRELLEFLSDWQDEENEWIRFLDALIQPAEADLFFRYIGDRQKGAQQKKEVGNEK